MYRLLDVSPVFENFDLRKVANIVLTKSFSFLEEIFGNAGEISPNSIASAVLESSLKQFVPKEMTPEVSNYYSRMSLRTLVGLPTIDINDRDDDAILRLRGSISWISKKKVDVTEIIRDMRDG